MQLMILGSPNNWYVQDLRRAAGDRHDIEIRSFEQLDMWVGGNVSDDTGLTAASRPTWDVVLVRSMPRGSLEQIIFRMDTLGQWQRQGITILNSPRAMEIAIDKCLSLQRLMESGIRVPRTYVCQLWKQAMCAFEQLGHDVVVKPLFGSEGRGITRISDPALAERAFKTLEHIGAAIYLQEFIAHDHQDLRLFVLGCKVWGMRRENKSDWRANVSRGANVEPIAVTPVLHDLAKRAAACVGTEISGIDVLIDPLGYPIIIEVNAVPGWRALARATGIDVAREILDYLETRK